MIAHYAVYRLAPEPKRPLPLLRYLLIACALGAAAYVAGAAAGIAVACYSDKAGNLCGLAGVLGVGPLASAVAMVFYAHVSTRRARHVP